jgi:hypothetical protein
MSEQRASDQEVATWHDDGWVLIEGLIPTAEIDAAVVDLQDIFPTGDAYHADPAGERERWLGHPAERPEAYTWPEKGPGFRPEQHRWQSFFPFAGSGALNRLCVHPALVDFAERALQSTDLRLYQALASAKYAGETNYEQPMHTDRNHSWLPARNVAPWWHLESFLYLSDVHDGNAPTHIVPRSESTGRETTVPLVMPKGDPDLYAAERAATGVRGSLLAYRTDVFHRGSDLLAPGAARFMLAVGYKLAGQDWIGYHTHQSQSTSAGWVAFAEGSTPRDLELFGWPPPGHPIWDAALIEQTATRYPNLDLDPWRRSLT